MGLKQRVIFNWSTSILKYAIKKRGSTSQLMIFFFVCSRRCYFLQLFENIRTLSHWQQKIPHDAFADATLAGNDAVTKY